MSLKNLIALSRDICIATIMIPFRLLFHMKHILLVKINGNLIENKNAHQSLANKFFDSFSNAFFITSPENILCHIQWWILTATVLEQVISRLNDNKNIAIGTTNYISNKHKQMYAFSNLGEQSVPVCCTAKSLFTKQCLDIARNSKANNVHFCLPAI